MPFIRRSRSVDPAEQALLDLEQAAFDAGYRYGVEDWMHGLFDRDNTNASDILHSLGSYRSDHAPVNGEVGVEGEVPDAIYWTIGWISGHRAGYDSIESGNPKAKELAETLSGE